jgi:hypothetical protein
MAVGESSGEYDEASADAGVEAMIQPERSEASGAHAPQAEPVPVGAVEEEVAPVVDTVSEEPAAAAPGASFLSVTPEAVEAAVPEPRVEPPVVVQPPSEPAPAPVRAAEPSKAPPPPMASPELPPGMVMIETRRERVEVLAVQPDEMAPRGRARPSAPPPPPSEPMVQVETQRNK